MEIRNNENSQGIEIRKSEPKYFDIIVEYSMWGTVKVKADSLEEAIKYAEDHIEELEIPDDPEYIDGSYKIDVESTIYNNL